MFGSTAKAADLFTRLGIKCREIRGRGGVGGEGRESESVSSVPFQVRTVQGKVGLRGGRQVKVSALDVSPRAGSSTPLFRCATDAVPGALQGEGFLRTRTVAFVLFFSSAFPRRPSVRRRRVVYGSGLWRGGPGGHASRRRSGGAGGPGASMTPTSRSADPGPGGDGPCREWKANSAALFLPRPAVESGPVNLVDWGRRGG